MHGIEIDRQCHTKASVIKQSTMGYFETLLTRENLLLMVDEMADIKLLLSEDDRSGLCEMLGREEWVAMFDIHVDSTAGRTDLASSSIKHVWDIMVKDMEESVLEFFNEVPMSRNYKVSSFFSFQK